MGISYNKWICLNIRKSEFEGDELNIRLSNVHWNLWLNPIKVSLLIGRIDYQIKIPIIICKRIWKIKRKSFENL